MPTRRTTRCPACAANPNARPYITMWNTLTKRKVAGTAAPCAAELEDYLRRHAHIEVYHDQDGGTEGRRKRVRKRDRERERRRRERRKRLREHRDGDDEEQNAEHGEDSTDGRRKGDADVVYLGCGNVSSVVVDSSEPVPDSSELVLETSEGHETEISREDQSAQEAANCTQPSPTRVAFVHPFAHIALAQRVWTAEARLAKGLETSSDED